MCGIAGFWSLPDQSAGAPRDIITAMIRQLVHRGPDAEGVWVHDEVALGHRRLAILDLTDAGAQPMHSACGRYVITFNGEIYNHLDLRKNLSFVGAAPPWKGHSDTETLLAAIKHWGLDETLKRAYGMFALALWDRSERRLSLARDRMGEKPLYWGWAGQTLLFGSELKALEVHPQFSNRISQSALAQYLKLSYVPTPLSIYSDIYKLEGGTILEVVGNPPPTPPPQPILATQKYESISIRRYWSLTGVIEAGARNSIMDDATAVDELEATIKAAVARQTISDVPVGAFLSGGVDSSLIAALMQTQSDRPVKTFTVKFDDAAYDESPHAEAVARYLGTDHTEVHVTEAETRAVIPELPHLYDEPFADASQIPTHLVCCSARSQVTVALSGDAGDELFGGYSRYMDGPRMWKNMARVPSSLRRGLGKSIQLLPETVWSSIETVQQQLVGQDRSMRYLGQKANRWADKMQSISSIDELHFSLMADSPDPPILIDTANDNGSTFHPDLIPGHAVIDPAIRMMIQDMQTFLPDDILCKVDRAAMGVSLETRIPLLDPDVIALATRLPLEMRIRGNVGKWALREVLYRYIPKEMIDRPKSGFDIPIGDWLKGPLRDWAEELLQPERINAGGLLDAKPIQQLWHQHLSGRYDWTRRLWNILMFQAWHCSRNHC